MKHVYEANPVETVQSKPGKLTEVAEYPTHQVVSPPLHPAPSIAGGHAGQADVPDIVRVARLRGRRRLEGIEEAEAIWHPIELYATEEMQSGSGE